MFCNAVKRNWTLTVTAPNRTVFRSRCLPISRPLLCRLWFAGTIIAAGRRLTVSERRRLSNSPILPTAYQSCVHTDPDAKSEILEINSLRQEGPVVLTIKDIIVHR